MGRSIGTTVALNTAVEQPLGGVILVSPLTTGRAQAGAMGLGSFGSVAGNAFDNLSKVTRLRAPLLVIHGTADEVIPFRMGKAVFEKATVKKEFIKIEGAEHNNLQNFGLQYWMPILNFVKN